MAVSIAAVVALVSLATGCGLFGQDDPTVGEAPRQPRPGGASVSLSDAGAEPRRPVVLDLRADTTVDLSFAVDLHLTQRTSDHDSAQVFDPPTTVQTVRFTVDAVDPTGADVSFEVIDAGIDPAGTALTDEQVLVLTASIRTVVGLGGTMRIDPRGRLTALDYRASPDLTADAVEALDAFEDNLATVVPILPAEPMGRGARWRTVTHTRSGGLTVRQTVTYELIELDADHLLYRAAITQDAGEQGLAGTDVTDAAATRLLAADLTGTTTGMMSLTSLTSESETAISGTQVVTSTGDDPASARLTQDLEVLVAVRPVTG